MQELIILGLLSIYLLLIKLKISRSYIFGGLIIIIYSVSYYSQEKIIFGLMIYWCFAIAYVVIFGTVIFISNKIDIVELCYRFSWKDNHVSILAVIYEEIIYRNIMIQLLFRILGHPVLIIFLSAIIFTFVHSFTSRKEFIEFFIFSLFLSVIYLLSKSIYITVFIHYFRNCVIIVTGNYFRGTISAYDK